jgi:transcriptional regulator with XRE-family HTH domain
MTKQTLADRLYMAMEGPPVVTPADLARACHIKPPSVSNWLNGRTKELRGDNLTRAARKLGVSATWLGLGEGPMKPTRSQNSDTPANVEPVGTPLAMMQPEGLYTAAMVREVARAIRIVAERQGRLFNIETAAGAEAFLHWLSVRAVLPSYAALENVIELDSRRHTQQDGVVSATLDKRPPVGGTHGKRRRN